MSSFIQLCTTFINGCAEFFNLPFPGLGGITFFQVFVAFLICDIIISTVCIVFGVNSDTGSFEIHSNVNKLQKTKSGKWVKK